MLFQGVLALYPDISIREPASGLLDQLELNAEIDKFAAPGNALTEQDIKLGFSERRRDLRRRRR